MTRQQELLTLADLIGMVTVAHAAVLEATAGSLGKVAAIDDRRQRLRELEDFGNTAADVSTEAFAAHGSLVAVVNDSIIADIVGAAGVLDGFGAAFNNAADAAERLQVLTDRWSAIAEAAAGLAQSARDTVNGIKTQVEAIRDELAAVLTEDPADGDAHS